MTTRTAKLVMPVGRAIASVQLIEEGETITGTIDLRSAPAGVRALFDEYEDIVNGQVFSRLDEIESRINALGIRVVFEDGREAPVSDLQIYPSTGDFSFKLASAPVQAMKSA